MELAELIALSKEVQKAYRAKNKKPWGASEYAQGFVGDVGDLQKLIMAKAGFRDIDGVDEKLAHELCDCLWSVLVIAEELEINLESEFPQKMRELLARIS